MDWSLLLLILAGPLFVMLRSAGPAPGLLLADVLALNTLGYSAGARIVCFLHQGVCVPGIVLLADCVALSALLAGCLLAHLVASRPSLLGDVRRWSELPRQVAWKPPEQLFQLLLLAGCTTVSLVFLSLVLSPWGLDVSSFSLVTGETSLLEVRKAISSGEYGYFAPGYLKQGRDVLFPLAVGAFLMFGIPQRSRLLLGFSVAVVVVAIMVSGQRTPLILFTAVAALGLYLCQLYSVRQRVVLSALICFAGVSLFLLMTTMLGREAEVISAGGSLAAPLGAIERLFARTPYENMLTVDAWWHESPTLGRTWLEDLSALLPGTQPMMSSRLHVELGGSAAGNSVLGLPADLYLSWSWLGALIFPWLYMFGALAIDRYCILSPSPFSKSLKIYLTFAALQWYSPYLFILNGGLILLAVVSLDYLRRSMPRRV